MYISAWCCVWWRPARDFTSSASGVGWAGSMAACRLPRPGFRHQCSKVQNRMKRRGSQGWRANCVFNDFLTKTNEIEIKILPVVGFPIFPKTITPVRLCSCSVSLSLPLPGPRGPFLSSLRQSLESDTGVNHYSLDLLITAHLRTRSSTAAFRLPTPPSPQ